MHGLVQTGVNNAVVTICTTNLCQQCACWCYNRATFFGGNSHGQPKNHCNKRMNADATNTQYALCCFISKYSDIITKVLSME